MSLKSLKNQTLRNKSTINSVNLTGGASTGPVITSIIVTDSNYNNLDDTALLPAGGYAKLIGSGFASGCSAYFNGSSVTTTFVSATEVRVVIPATTAGTYNVMLFNPSTAGAIYLNLGISSAPTFTTTAGSLGTSYETTAVSTSIAATGDDPITYALYSGSLPTGVTLASNGTLSGTSPVEASSTTYSFVVQATDAQLQDTTRSFSLTISSDIVTWSTPAADFAYTLEGNAAMSNVSLSAASAAGYNITYAANTLPTGVSLSGNTVFGTPTVEQTVYTALTATAATTGRSATRYVSWSVALGDAYWKYNTLLLPGASTTFVDDASTNNFAVTINGDTKPNSLNPYTPGYYSNYFDGLGDWLTIPNNTGFAFGSGAFTVEMWVYIAGSSGTVANYSNGQSSNSNFGWELYQVNTTTMQFSVFEGATQYISSSTSFKQNAWNHIACVRSSNTLTTYVNGVAGGTTANVTGVSINDPASATLKLCSYGNGSDYVTGYISNFRVVKGTAVYTAAFTPSTTPLTAISGTSLLTCQSNRFIDNSASTLTITVTGNTLISSFDPFVPNSSYSTYGSGYFDGTGDYLSTPQNAAFEMGSGDFTYEWWMNPSSAPAQAGIWIQSPNSSTFGPLWIAYQSGTLNLYATTSNGSWNIGNSLTISGTIPLNTWTHVAVTRSGGVWRSFINGVQFWTITNAGSLYASNSISTIGGYTDSLYFTGYLTDVRVVKGTAVYTSAFTPPSAPLTAISGTSLLTLQNNQPVNNSTFLDNSTNNFLVTRNGNTTQGTFSPYGGNWSNYFDGTGDYLTLNGTPGTTLTGNFTVEAWVYVINFAASRAIICIGDAFGNPGVMFFIDTAGKLGIAYANSRPYTGSGSLTANTWNHVAFVRNSGLITGYINGVSQGTLSTANTFSGTTSYIGLERYNGGAGGVIMFGYISNLRIVNSTAVYTGTFTPPTTPLTPITNTGLLTCADNRLIDDSINNFTITKNGDVSVQRFSPFNPSSVTPTSYSGYFDGTDDFLTLPSSSAFSMDTGDFTIEAWIYTTSSVTQRIVSSTGNNFEFVLVNTGGNVYLNWYDGVVDIASGSNYVPQNSWVHVAVSRSGTSLRLFINGVISASSTNSVSLPATPTLYIGRYGASNLQAFTGYISNLRITKGTSVYTSNFTPSTTPLTAIANTSLLTLQSPTFIDNSTNNFTITAFGNSQPRQQNPFGFTSATTNGYTVSTIGGSGYFDGTGDWITFPSPNNLAFGTGDFTIEMWIYHTATQMSTDKKLFGNWSGGTDSYQFYLRGNSNRMIWQIYNQNSPDVASLFVPTNSWNHLAWVRSGTVIYSFINGVLSDTGTGVTNSANGNGTPTLGANNNGADGPYQGYISDFRVIKGLALYKSNFVPPSAPLTAIQNTGLLTNMTGAGIYDASMMNNLETLGDAKLSTAVSKFGGSSMSFDGSGDYLSANPIGAGDLGTGDFTIEYWMNASAVGSYSGPAGTQEVAGFATAGMWRCLNRFNSSNGIYFAYTTGSTFVDITFTATNYNDGTWHHVAYVKSGTSLKAYVDGTQVGTAATVTQSLTSGKKLTLGYNPQDNAYYTGYVDDLRITKGYARYTSNFTPPTSALQIK